MMYQMDKIWGMGGVETLIPTIGFTVDVLHYMMGIEFNSWDVGRENVLRRLWEHFYPDTYAVVFVVDATDREHMQTARRALHRLFEAESLRSRNVPLLVFANKYDLADRARSLDEVSEILDLAALDDVVSATHVEACSALRLSGLTTGFDWLFSTLDWSPEM